MEFGRIDSKEYLETMRLPYFYMIRNFSQNIANCQLREGSESHIKELVFQVAMKTGEQYLMLGSMKGRMPTLESEELLTSLLMPMKKMWELNFTGTADEVGKLIDEMYLAYSDLRRNLNPEKCDSQD